MDKHTYMRQFARQVRWRLPKAEADGILADYEELLGQRLADQDADLVQDLGSPHQAARLLTERKPYYSWLILFCGMVCCLLLPTVMLLRTAFFQASTVSMALLLLLGMSACLVQFHPHPGIRKTPVPKALLFSPSGPDCCSGRCRLDVRLPDFRCLDPLASRVVWHDRPLDTVSGWYCGGSLRCARPGARADLRPPLECPLHPGSDGVGGVCDDPCLFGQSGYNGFVDPLRR